MPKDNWTFYIEGIGPTHNCEEGDANTIMLEALQKVQQQGHRVFQARYSSARGEENWLEHSTREMQEGFKAESEERSSISSDPHSELVQMGVDADATREQGSTEVGLRESGEEHEGGESGEGVHSRDAEGSVQKPSRKKIR